MNKECLPFQNPEMTVGKVEDEDPDDLQDKTDRYGCNQDATNGVFKLRFGIQRDATPLYNI